MGCDIHLHAEIKVNGTWYTYATPDVPRSYSLFARMAGVRARDGVEPISDPRGLPADVGVVAMLHSDEYGPDGHSHSWLSAEEILLLDETRGMWEGLTGAQSEAWMRHGSCDLFGYLFGNSYPGWTKYPEERPEGVEDVRFVFWFDN